jgi:sulfonate transport system permease protein
MVSLGAFFPLIINLRAGVSSIDGGYVRLARSFGASGFFLFRSIILPGTVPSC